jgi:hypothetical protein
MMLDATAGPASAIIAAVVAAFNGDTTMTDPMMQFFDYAHLPPHLQVISQPFYYMAHNLVTTLPSNPERTAGLRKLLEAKDCMVRAKLYKEPT